MQSKAGYAMMTLQFFIWLHLTKRKAIFQKHGNITMKDIRFSIEEAKISAGYILKKVIVRNPSALRIWHRF